MLLGYVCVKVVSRYPSKGGLITYLIEGFGKGRLVGVASWLGYIAAIVIVTAMVAVFNLDLLAFSGYPSVSKIISSVALTFFAYLGFNVITFAVGRPA